MLKDPNLIKTQDVFTVIRYISYNSYGKNMAWNWIQLNWEYLVDRWDNQIMACSLCLIPSTSSFFFPLLYFLYNIWNGILLEVKDHGIFLPGK